MTADQGTNLVYFSDRLPRRHADFFAELSEVLTHRAVGFGLLPHTNDIWCRDYMPIQVSKDRFVQFKYDPKYLHDSKEDRETITDAKEACSSIGIVPELSDVKIDGGNIIKAKTKAILTERIFVENPDYSHEDLLGEIKRLLNVQQLIIVPEDPRDKLGHADGMVGFLDETTVFVNDYAGDDKDLGHKVKSALVAGGLSTITMPYAPYQNKSDFDATGIYINYLHIGKFVVYPIYGIEADEAAHKFFTEHFGSNAVAVRANTIAKEGGVLNCVSWSI